MHLKEKKENKKSTDEKKEAWLALTCQKWQTSEINGKVS
jgi:hypothetical protein